MGDKSCDKIAFAVSDTVVRADERLNEQATQASILHDDSELLATEQKRFGHHRV